MSREKVTVEERIEAAKACVEGTMSQGCLDRIKATEYHRIALTVMALGGDPTAFGCKPDGTNIDLIAEGTYNYFGDDLGMQGLNGWIWALISLNASNAEVPENASNAEVPENARYQKK